MDSRTALWQTVLSHTALGCAWGEASVAFRVLRAHFQSIRAIEVYRKSFLQETN